MAISQREATNWFFGNFGAIKFTPSGVIPLSGSAMSVDEGCATISSNTGRLQFYTKGTMVYNRLHAKMKNGDGLFGNPGSTQNSIIIPAPRNDSIYYIFTTEAAGGSKGLNVSTVNIRRDGGLGEVTDKNIHLADNIFEKITAVQNCNRRDVWIAVREFDSDIYKVFSVTSAGISGPVVSNTGLQITDNSSNAIGAMKFSNDGTMLAAAHGYSNDIIELLSFDNTTGLLTNPRTFRCNTSSPLANSVGTYGIEFSPNNKLLYCSSYLPEIGNSNLFQFDVSLNSAAAIASSKKVIQVLPEEILAALQIGIDKKIYASSWGDYSLSVISNPDIPDTGCHFIHNVVRVGIGNGHNCQGGLPSFIQSYFNSSFNSFDFSRGGNCEAKTLGFTLNKTSGIDSVKWDFGDNTRSTLLSPTHTFSAAGYYSVTLIVYKQDCSFENDSITHQIWIAGSNDLLGNDTSICGKEGLSLRVNLVESEYLWNNGSTNDSIRADSSGLYWLQVVQNGCTISDSMHLTITPPPIPGIGRDTTICSGQSLVLDAGNQGSHFLWNTGDTIQRISVSKGGQYSVTVNRNQCLATSMVRVKAEFCVLLPTAFSPNGDGLNDEFGILNVSGITNPDLRVYDRWGKLLFRSTAMKNKWNGKYNGKLLPIGPYVWMISYVDPTNHIVRNVGTVMLVR